MRFLLARNKGIQPLNGALQGLNALATKDSTHQVENYSKKTGATCDTAR